MFMIMLGNLQASNDTAMNKWKKPLSTGHFPSGSMVKEATCNVRDPGDVSLIRGWGRSPGGVNGNPFQYSCLENPRDRGAWRATVYSVTKNQTLRHRAIKH